MSITQCIYLHHNKIANPNKNPKPYAKLSAHLIKPGHDRIPTFFIALIEHIIYQFGPEIRLAIKIALNQATNDNTKVKIS